MGLVPEVERLMTPLRVVRWWRALGCDHACSVARNGTQLEVDQRGRRRRSACQLQCRDVEKDEVPATREGDLARAGEERIGRIERKTIRALGLLTSGEGRGERCVPRDGPPDGGFVGSDRVRGQSYVGTAPFEGRALRELERERGDPENAEPPSEV